MKKQARKQLVMGIVVAAGVAAVVSAYFWVYRKPARQPAAPRPVFAAAGQTVPGFPPEFILDSKAKVSSSYSISYNPALNQYTATFSSTMTMMALFGAYKDYLTANGWTITNLTTRYPTSRGIYAKKGQSDFSVAIIDKNQSREVIVSYVVK